MVYGPWLLWFILCTALFVGAIKLDLSEETYIRNVLVRDFAIILLLVVAVICAIVALIERIAIYPIS